MPQRKREKQTKAMLEALKVGDEIVTYGGILGNITIIKDDTITVETSADRTKIMLERNSVRAVLNKKEE
jgi:preprotein translocase subunit YajC